MSEPTNGIVSVVNVLPTISEDYCHTDVPLSRSTTHVKSVTMREKRGGAMSKMQKLRKRLSLSFGRLSMLSNL
ncbi:unnamed protein product [Plutella xylostella]|uniref:(diamondback moth) hypothetical protein n=1 Tax=Plutella xylostella TaxID=51655 RepID=A0A8S4CZE2_PLUXY|nr:unnamed protein product [Plutella xylostella]